MQKKQKKIFKYSSNRGRIVLIILQKHETLWRNAFFNGVRVIHLTFTWTQENRRKFFNALQQEGRNAPTLFTMNQSKLYLAKVNKIHITDL